MKDALARLIMRRAAANPPGGRESWAQAMQAEFDTLEGDGARLAWAAGCWRATAAWRFKKDWIFLLALVAVPAMLGGAILPLLFFAVYAALPFQVSGTVFYVGGLMQIATGAVLLAAWRPDHRRKSAVFAACIPTLASWLKVRQMNDWDSGGFYVIFDAPPMIGVLALLAVCFAAAQVGADIGRRPRRSGDLTSTETAK